MIRTILLILPLLVNGVEDDDTTQNTTTAQANPYYENNLTLNWTEPFLNKANCDSGSTEIEIAVSYTGLLADSRLYQWFTEEDSTCTKPKDSEDYELISGATYSTTLTFTYEELYNRNEADVCETDTPGEVYKLCIAIDTSGDTTNNQFISSPNGQIEALEPSGYVLFTVDTQGPPAPTLPLITSMDSILRVNASIPSTTDVEYKDVASWRVRYREVEDGTDSPPETETDAETETETEAPIKDCSSWTTFTESTGGRADTSSSVDIPATNGVEYELCVFALDFFENPSPPSPSVRGTAIDECDFIECYPGELKHGHCNALGLQTPAWVLLGLLGLMGVRRSRNRQGSSL